MIIFKIRIVLYGCFLGLFIWFFDAILDTLIFYEGERSFFYCLFTPIVHEFWVRILILVIIIGFSFAVQIKINTLNKTAEQLIISEEGSKNAYNRLDFYKDLFFHDINNILQHILSAIDLYENYIKLPNNKQKVENIPGIIRDQVMRGAKLISNIRKISELEIEKAPLKIVDLCEHLNESVNLLTKSYGEKDIKIEIDTPLRDLRIQASDLFHDVCDNILFNAIKHNNEPIPEILIKISKLQKDERNYIRIEFIDNGRGIEGNRKKSIFKRGFNDDRSTSGMGLGLSLVKKIIESYDGDIWVEDKVEGDYTKGSKFIVLIPEGISNV
ncbi:hypothetical protein LCGC14_2137370 [marine sediment metagenome]|uniref:histidine kinase n=1 Tax=marine sediment metagenome TaxID=412755 RepID=A0A0F9DZN2_9ZZZZ